MKREKKGKDKMFISNFLINFLMALLIPLTICVFNYGIQNANLSNLNNKVIIIENNSKSEFDKKLSIERFNEFSSALNARLDRFKLDNDSVHNEIKNTMREINNKIDLLIERK